MSGETRLFLEIAAVALGGWIVWRVLHAASNNVSPVRLVLNPAASILDRKFSGLSRARVVV